MIAIAILSIYVSLIVYLPSELYSPLLYINPLVRFLDFVIGIYLSLFFVRYNSEISEQRLLSFTTLPKTLIVFLIVFIIGFLVVISLWLDAPQKKFSIFYWPLICVLIVLSSLFGVYNNGGGIKSKLLLLLGDISFTFFMIHQVVIRYCTVLFTKVFWVDSVIIRDTIIFLISFFCAILLEKYYVRPIGKFLSKGYKS